MASTIKEQMAKCGDSIFHLSDITIKGAEWFVPAKTLAEMRRTAISTLASKRVMQHIAHDIRLDSGTAQHPLKRLPQHYNVVNSLARRFYQRHGVEHIVEGLDSWSSTYGERVMESSYCIRREIGQCLKRGSTLRDKLYLEHGRHRYLLDFDCAQCRMSLIDCSEPENRVKR